MNGERLKRKTYSATTLNVVLSQVTPLHTQQSEDGDSVQS